MNKFLLIIFVMMCHYTFSQQLPLDNQYMLTKFSISPAYAGTEESAESYLSYRKNWVGFKDAPESEFISINAPLQKSGIGAYVVNSKAGIFKNNLVSIAYAYHIKINDNQKIHLGLSAGYLYSSIDFSSISDKKIIDPVIGESRLSEGSAFDAGFGAVYQYKQFHTGITLPRLLESTIQNHYMNDKTVYTLARHFKVHFANTFKMGKDLKMESILMVSQSTGSKIFYEEGLLFKYKNRVWAGVNYKKGNAFGLVAGLIYNRFVMNYAHEFAFAGPLSQSGGTHEVSVGIIIGKSSKITYELPFVKSSKPYNEWVN